MLNRNFKLVIAGLVSSVTLLTSLTITAKAFASTASDGPKLEYASPLPGSSKRDQSSYHGNNHHNDHGNNHHNDHGNNHHNDHNDHNDHGNNHHNDHGNNHHNDHGGNRR